MHILYTLPFHSRLFVSFVAFIVSLIHCNTIGVARIFDWGGPNPQKFGCLHRK